MTSLKGVFLSMVLSRLTSLFSFSCSRATISASVSSGRRSAGTISLGLAGAAIFLAVAGPVLGEAAFALTAAFFCVFGVWPASSPGKRPPATPKPRRAVVKSIARPILSLLSIMVCNIPSARETTGAVSFTAIADGCVTNTSAALTIESARTRGKRQAFASPARSVPTAAVDRVTPRRSSRCRSNSRARLM